MTITWYCSTTCNALCMGIHQIWTGLNEIELLLRSDRTGIRFNQGTLSQRPFLYHTAAPWAPVFSFRLKKINLTHVGTCGYCKWVSDGVCTEFLLGTFIWRAISQLIVYVYCKYILSSFLILLFFSSFCWKSSQVTLWQQEILHKLQNGVLACIWSV